MSTLPIGHRVRARRKALGLTQTALARTLGISISYVNLIEHDKRSIGGALLNRMAEALEMDTGTLDGAQERRVLDELLEIAAATDSAARPEPETARDLLAQHEPWARVLLSLHRAVIRDQGTIMALSNRLNQDPVLDASVNDMLASATAIRSVADIVADAPDLEGEQRARFDAILQEEATRLSDVARTLARAFEGAQADVSGLTAPEEVDDFLYRRSNHFPVLEDFADSLGFREAADPAALAARLEKRHGITIQRVAQEDAPRASVFDDRSKVLRIASSASPATLRFELARCIATLEGGEIIRAEVGDAAELASDAGRDRGIRALAAYTAAAITLPYARFHDHAETMRYDIDALAVHFGASAEQLCHRFTTLRRPGAEGVPFAMLRANAAGYLTKRFPLPRLPMPRHGGACPLWAVYSAMQTPDLRVARVAEFPNGDRFFMLARATRPQASAYGQTRPTYALMLACEIVHADRLVYSDGLDLSTAGRADPVGSTCILCPRTDCAHRQEASIRMGAG